MLSIVKKMKDKSRLLLALRIIGLIWLIIIILFYYIYHKPIAPNQVLGILQACWQIAVGIAIIAVDNSSSSRGRKFKYSYPSSWVSPGSEMVRIWCTGTLTWDCFAPLNHSLVQIVEEACIIWPRKSSIRVFDSHFTSDNWISNAAHGSSSSH
jgi:hypothetical protein